MRFNNTCAVMCIMTIWVTLDVSVIIVDRDDPKATEYWTNQVWLLALIAKIAILLEIYKYNGKDIIATRLGWTTSCFFLIVGCAQAGVLGAFFTLTLSDSTLLDSLLASKKHSIADVIVWNHVRHVSVCFIHLAIVWSLRDYLSANAYTNQDYSFCSVGFKASHSMFCIMTFCMPLGIGLLHSMIWSDQEIYMYSETTTGYRCQAMYAVFSSLAATYFLTVPLSKEPRYIPQDAIEDYANRVSSPPRPGTFYVVV